jgi:hypothetical protein
MKFLCGCLHQFPAALGAYGCQNCRGDEGPACASVNLADPTQAHDAEELVRCTREVFEADALRAAQRELITQQITDLNRLIILEVAEHARLKKGSGNGPRE